MADGGLWLDCALCWAFVNLGAMQCCAESLKLPTTMAFSCSTGNRKLPNPLGAGFWVTLPSVLAQFPASQHKPRSTLAWVIDIAVASCLHRSPHAHSPEAARKIHGILTLSQRHLTFPQVLGSAQSPSKPTLHSCSFL